jgi:hypothetical protein
MSHGYNYPEIKRMEDYARQRFPEAKSIAYPPPQYIELKDFPEESGWIGPEIVVQF